jgi:hypothetical protein
VADYLCSLSKVKQAPLDFMNARWGAPVQIIVMGAERSYVMDLARKIDELRREGR